MPLSVWPRAPHSGPGQTTGRFGRSAGASSMTSARDTTPETRSDVSLVPGPSLLAAKAPLPKNRSTLGSSGTRNEDGFGAAHLGTRSVCWRAHFLLTSGGHARFRSLFDHSSGGRSAPATRSASGRAAVDRVAAARAAARRRRRLRTALFGLGAALPAALGILSAGGGDRSRHRPRPVRPPLAGR